MSQQMYWSLSTRGIHLRMAYRQMWQMWQKQGGIPLSLRFPVGWGAWGRMKKEFIDIVGDGSYSLRATLIEMEVGHFQ